MESTTPTTMRVSELSFDFQNPRLVEYDLPKGATDEEVIKILWDAMDVRELVLSIAASGFFAHEPLIVTQENGKNIVIEGNRRLAAVKVLLDPDIGENLQTTLPLISTEDKEELRELPIVFETRESAWQYIGFKHVNGPAKWSSYAKSEYISKVHQEFGVPLEDIARQIGDTHKTVQRLFRGMMIIGQAERWKVFSREDRWRNHFSFSHLYTGLDYPGISSFIGLRPESEEDTEPIPLENKDQLRELCLWLYGSKKEARPPIVVSQNPDLRHLDAVVASREAVAALRGGGALSHAFEISRPSSNVFEESLYASKRNLEKTHSLVSTGYAGSEQLLTVAKEVATLAEDLYEQMNYKSGPRGTRRSAERG